MRALTCSIISRAGGIRPWCAGYTGTRRSRCTSWWVVCTCASFARSGAVYRCGPITTSVKSGPRLTPKCPRQVDQNNLLGERPAPNSQRFASRRGAWQQPYDPQTYLFGKLPD